MKITCVSLQSKLDELISLLTRILHPASIAVKHALFSSSNTCGRMKKVHPASIAVKHALFSSNNTCGRMKEAHPASIVVKRVIFIEGYASTVKSVH